MQSQNETPTQPTHFLGVSTQFYTGFNEFHRLAKYEDDKKFKLRINFEEKCYQQNYDRIRQIIDEAAANCKAIIVFKMRRLD